MTAPRSFYIIAIAALLWSLMGDAAYLMQVTMDLAELAKTDAYQAQIFAAMPMWVWSAYAIAVWVGTLGSIALLMRRAIAVPFYAVSLGAVLIQFSYSFLGTDMLSVKGPSVAIFPAVIILLGIAELLYARSAKARGLLR